jgi:hypothetical protein
MDRKIDALMGKDEDADLTGNSAGGSTPLPAPAPSPTVTPQVVDLANIVAWVKANVGAIEDFYAAWEGYSVDGDYDSEVFKAKKTMVDAYLAKDIATLKDPEVFGMLGAMARMVTIAGEKQLNSLLPVLGLGKDAISILGALGVIGGV